MSYAPTHPTATAKEELRQLVANCATFQGLVGAADAAAALPRVHLTSVILSEGVEVPRPFAMVTLPGKGEGTAFEYQSLAQWEAKRKLWLWLVSENFVPDVSDDEQIFIDTAEKILDEIFQQQDQGATLPIRDVRNVVPPEKTHPVEEAQDQRRFWVQVHELELD